MYVIDEGVDVTDEEAVRKAIKRVKSDGGVSILSLSGHDDACSPFIFIMHLFDYLINKYCDSQPDSSFTKNF